MRGIRLHIIMLMSALLGLVLFACAGGTKMEGPDMEMYYRALKDTEPDKVRLMEPGTALEEAAVKRFTDFYAHFTAAKISAELDALYDEDAYFQDGFRQVRSREAIRAYFLGSTEPVQECTFSVLDVAHSHGNYYFRWIMRLTVKRKPHDLIELPGMSHVRFNDQGRIVFHHDYWETAAFYEHLPVIGSIIRWIKNRI